MTYLREIFARGLPEGAEGIEGVEDRVPFALYRITMPEWASAAP